MDKETFSQYGWLVVVVVIVALMITFATPFGQTVVSDTLGIITNVGNAAGGSFGGSGGGAGGEQAQRAPGLWDGNTHVKTWNELLNEGVIHVDNGVVYTNLDTETWENASSDVLSGYLILPDDGSVTKIGDATYDADADEYAGHIAFESCRNLTGVLIPNTVAHIGYDAFYGCHNMAEINIPDSVTYISAFAFGDTVITNITLPAGVTLDNDVFADACELRTITIPKEINELPERVGDCLCSLETIYYEGTMQEWRAIEGGTEWLYNTPCKQFIFSDGEYQVPGLYNDGYLTYTWGGMLRDGVLALTSDGVLSTGGEPSLYEENPYSDSLYGELRLPDDGTVKSIAAEGFPNCAHLTGFVFSDSVTTIGAYAFGQTPLKNVVIPNGVTVIESGAFSRTALSNVTLPATITTIGDFAFDSSYLSELKFEGTTAQWNAISFGADWYAYTDLGEVQCSDGTITLE